MPDTASLGQRPGGCPGSCTALACRARVTAVAMCMPHRSSACRSYAHQTCKIRGLHPRTVCCVCLKHRQAHNRPTLYRVTPASASSSRSLVLKASGGGPCRVLLPSLRYALGCRETWLAVAHLKHRVWKDPGWGASYRLWLTCSRWMPGQPRLKRCRPPRGPMPEPGLEWHRTRASTDLQTAGMILVIAVQERQ